MNTYRVSFYNVLLNSDGHNFKCLQRQMDVESDGPSQALVLAERLVVNDRLYFNCVEVTHLSSDHHDLEHSSTHSPAPANTYGAVSSLGRGL